MMRSRSISRIVTGVLIAASLVASFLQHSPEEVARQHCAELGVAPDKLAMVSYQRSGLPVAASATIEFRIQGSSPPKKLVAELRQPMYFLPWHFVRFREEAQQ